MKSSLTVLCAAVASVLCAVAQAQESRVSIKIEPQPMRQALKDLGQQTGLSIVFREGETAGWETIKAPRVSGDLSAREALEKVLHNTQLRYRFVNPNTVLISGLEENTAAVQGGADAAANFRLAQITASTQQEEEQTQEGVRSEEAASTDGKSTEVVVTGSRLRGVNATSPVTVITIEQIKAQGISNVEGIIRSLPQNYANITPTSALDNSSSVGTLGNAAANLRGLGEDGTLVLVNGRRVAGSTVFSGSTVNLNTIPFSAVERVEVLTDGASAIYGADAVAGVINFILRKGYDAEEVTSLRYDSSSNGGDVRRVQQTLGTSWGRGSFSGSMSYDETDAISSAKVGWTSLDQRSRGGDDWRWTVDTAGVQPGAVYGPDVEVDLHDLYPDFYPPGSLYSMPGPVLGAVDPARNASVPLALAEITAANLRPWDNIRPDQSDARKSFAAHFHVDQDITDAISGFAELSFARNKSQALSRPLVVSRMTIPTSNPFNNTGQALLMDYAFTGESAAGLVPYSVNVNNARNITAVLGFNARLPFADWQSEGYANYSLEKTYSQAFDGINEAALAAALADTNPATAFNPFGDGSQQNAQTVAGLYMVSDDPYSKPTNTAGKTTQFNASANGSLFSLPGGKVSAVIGADYRNEYREYDAYIATTLSSTRPERDTIAVLSELALPIVGAGNRFPLVHSLELRAAGRWEEYGITGPFDGAGAPNRKITYSNVSPSFGLAWRLTPGFKVRLNRGESFKVPRLSDLFTIEGEPYNLGYVVGLLAGQGIVNDPISGLPIMEYDFTPSGNPTVRPETSRTLSYGFDWNPTGMLEGLSVSLSYIQIETRDVIGNSLNLMFEDGDTFLRTSVARNPDGSIAYFQGKPINFSYEGAKAIDLYVTHRHASRFGQLEYGASGTYTDEQYSQTLETTPRVYRDGDTRGPDKIKLRNWLTVSRGNHGGTLTVNYISAYNNTAERAAGGPRPIQRIPSYITFDLTSHYEVKGFRVLGGVRNLFDKDFPFLMNRTPFDPRRVDINGRVVFLEVSKSFNVL